MSRTIIALAAGLALSPAAQAAITALDLGTYTHAATHALPAGPAAEASAITWNWDTDTLFVLGDEGDAVVEVDKTGRQLSVMTLSGFDDTEGITYVGSGRFVVTEERLQDAYLLTYSAGGSVARASLPTASLGDTVGNVGVEGLSFDPVSDGFVFVKERVPQAVNVASIDFSAGTAAVSSLFSPSLGVLDLSDVQVLRTVPGLAGTADADNLLIFSQESSRLLEVSRSGTVLSSFDFTALASDAEGVTIDGDGVIYVVGETPAMYVLTPPPIPEPGTYALLGAGLVLVGGLARRRTRAAR